MTTLEDVTRLLPDYALGRELGRGEFGVVWQARHLQLGRDVAVKQLAGPVAADPAHAARFRREARLLASLDHPHVVRVFDYREEGSSRLLVMELLTGGTLADRRAAGLTLAPAVASVMAAASGLHHVHEQGVLHRDVKPENLMFDGRGVLKVTDFGIARGDETRSTAVNVTRAGEFFGTPAYIAPEQAAPTFGGGWPPVGRAADQYSLAAVLYELLSGHFTHDASGGWVGLCAARLNEEATPLRTYVPALPAPVDDAVMRGLARDPAARYASVEDFAVALGDAMRVAYGDAWYADSDVAIREPGVIRDAALPMRASAAPAGSESAVAATASGSPPRRGRLVALGVVVALAAGVGTYLAIGGDSGSTPSPPDGVPVAGLPLQLREDWSARTGGNVFASPVLAGTTVVVGSEDGKVYGFDAASGGVRWTAPTGGPVRASAVVDGDTAYVGSLDGNVYALDVADGTVRWKHALDYEIVSSAAVGDGMVVVGADGLRALDAATGAERWHLSTDDVVVSSPTISDGIVVVGSNDGSVYAARLADGSTPLWTRAMGGPVESSPAVAGGVVYAGSRDGTLRALDLRTGSVRWTATFGSAVKSSPVVDGDRVVVGTDDGRLVAVTTDAGTPEWTFRAARAIDSSPADAGGVIVVGSNDGHVYAVDAATGTVAGRFDTSGPVLSSPLIDGDRIIVGSQDDHVYAIGGLGVTIPIEVREPGRATRRVALDDALLVGRTVDGLVLVDERCSRRHCALRPDGDGVVVEDLGSTNGTFVNGVRITGPIRVAPGAEIVVGSTRLLVAPAPDPPVAARPTTDPDVDATIGRLRASVVGGTVTIVFTDIVDSTSIGSALGDGRWFGVLERHDAVVRALLAEHSGTEIKHQGDGFMLSFPSARQGVCFGAAMQRELGRHRDLDPGFPVRVRIGVHTGEVIRVDGDLFGRHVNIAARVAGSAGTDEVLVSRLVYDIVNTMGDLEFGPAREVVLKGLDEPFALYPLTSA